MAKLSGFERRRRRVRTALKARAGGKPRLSVHRSGRHIYAQVIDDAAGKTVRFYIAGKKGRVLRRFYPNGIAADYELSEMKVAAFDYARALADDLEGLDRGSKVEDAIKRIAATMACHAAVKANYPLTMEKMAHIL